MKIHVEVLPLIIGVILQSHVSTSMESSPVHCQSKSPGHVCDKNTPPNYEQGSHVINNGYRIPPHFTYDSKTKAPIAVELNDNVQIMIDKKVLRGPFDTYQFPDHCYLRRPGEHNPVGSLRDNEFWYIGEKCWPYWIKLKPGHNDIIMSDGGFTPLGMYIKIGNKAKFFEFVFPPQRPVTREQYERIMKIRAPAFALDKLLPKRDRLDPSGIYLKQWEEQGSPSHSPNAGSLEREHSRKI